MPRKLLSRIRAIWEFLGKAAGVLDRSGDRLEQLAAELRRLADALEAVRRQLETNAAERAAKASRVMALVDAATAELESAGAPESTLAALRVLRDAWQHPTN